MSATLNNLVTLSNFSISTGLNFFAKQAVNAAEKIAKCTSHILDSATTSLEQLLPDLRPISIGEMLLQAKKTGSALLTTSKGDYLIEITKDKAGRYTFHAVGESLEPVIIRERRKRMSRAVWDAKVTKHLQKYISKASTVDYGVTQKRWKQDTFSNLMEHFAAEDFVKKEGETVTLSLPDNEETLIFQGPHAELKAEIVLKYFYHLQKTPAEEAASKPWDLMKGAFVGYVYFSGHMLAPWVNNTGLSHQAVQMPAVGMTTAMTMPSLQQNIMNIATVYAATMLINRDTKMAAFGSLFSLLPSGNAMSIDLTKENHEAAIGNIAQSSETRKASAAAKSVLAKRTTAPITIVSPLPNILATPGVSLTLQIDMKQHYVLSDPNTYLELSIKQSNGAAAPSWLTMSMGDLSLIKMLSLGGDARDICRVDDYAYIALDNGVIIVYINNASNPVVAGSYMFPGVSQGGFISVQGDHAFYGTFGTNSTLYILNIRNPSNISLASTIDLSRSGYDVPAMAMSGNDIYVPRYFSLAGTSRDGDLNRVNVTDPLNATFQGIYGWQFNNGEKLTCIQAFGNKVWVGEDSNQLDIFDVSYPSSPTMEQYPLAGSITSAISIQENYFFRSRGAENGLSFCILSANGTPNCLSSLYSGTFTGVILRDIYLYGCGGGIVRVLDPDLANSFSNPRVQSSFNTGGSANSALLRGNNIFTANGLPGLAIIDAAKRKLSGEPSSRGLLHIDVIATDDLGNTAVDPITIHIGAINVALPIPNQQVYVGNSTLFTLAPGTFEFPGITLFTYTAALQGGVPLPSFIGFDANTCTFIFTPISGDQNTYRIEVTANDGYTMTSATFDLSVPDRPPVLEQPLSDQMAYSYYLFEYIFSANTFSDIDGDTLSYSTGQLPDWLRFDPILRKFYGTPFGKGVFPIVVYANDGFGGSASVTFTITVPNSAPEVFNAPGTQLATVGFPFTYMFNTNTFYDVDNDPLTYAADQLPGFLTFNPATRTFSGTPQVQDAGNYYIILQAQDPTGAGVSTIFSLSVLSSSSNLPPVVVFQIPDFSVTSGVPFNHTFSSETFEDPEHQTLNYTTTLEGGAPLPSGLYFDGDSLTLSGVVPVPQALRIAMKATDPYGAFAIDTFIVTVIDGTNYPPIVLNPLPDELATVGDPFFKQVPANTFKDLSGDPLTITVIQSGGMPLPSWLKWDAKKQTFFGTPGLFDTNFYAIREHTIDVWASDGTGSVKTSFKLSVNGESFWALFLKYGFTFASIAGTGIALWKSRALIWNYLCKEKYTTPTQEALVGDPDPYSHKLKLKRHEVREIVFLLNNKPLPQVKPLPDGIIYDGTALTGIPTGKDNGRFTVRIVHHDGYINEEFELIIKKKGKADPKKQPGCTEVTRRHLTALCTDLSSKIKGDEEKGRFGQMNDHLLSSQEMKPLDKEEEEEDQS